MMKKIIGILLILAFVGAIGHAESIYYREGCKVIDISETIVTVEDNCGFIWSFYAETNEDYTVGECVTLKMFDNHTSGNISDDEIIDVK